MIRKCPAGCDSSRRGAFNAAVSLEGEFSGFPTTLRVSRNGRLFWRAFDFGLNAEVRWSPDASRFAITGSADGANDQYRTPRVCFVPTNHLELRQK